MNKFIGKVGMKVVAFLLVLTLSFVFVTGCGRSFRNSDDIIQDFPNSDSESYGVNYYEDETDSFVIGLIVADLETGFDVFTGTIQLENGEEVLGLGFTDYAEAFELEEEEKTAFSAGFVALPGETEISDDEIKNGLEITCIDDENDEYGFVFTFIREPFQSHCVVFNRYIQYGISERAAIFYSEEEFVYGECNQSLGALYSYDDERYLYDPGVGSFLLLTGTSLTSLIDYDAIKTEINRIIATQDFNFSLSDIQTVTNIAQEALITYLLSLQQETFLGYNVSDLIAISAQLDPLECVRITADGLAVIEVEPTPPPEPDAFTKWLTGIVCGIAIVGSVALSVFIPALAPVSGVIIGSAIEVFNQVIIEKQTLENINFAKVGIAAISGAISAIPGVNLVGDALIGGLTNAVFTMMDGGSVNEMATSFALGVGSGVVLGGLFKGVATSIGKIANRVAPNTVKKFNGFIADHVIDLDGRLARRVDDAFPDAARFNSRKAAKTTIANQQNGPILSKHKQRTVVSRKSKQHILYGECSQNGKWTGGHSPKIKSDGTYRWELLSLNSDGTTTIRIKEKILPNGNTVGGKSVSTLFPDSWSDQKILKSIKKVGSQKPIGYRVSGSGGDVGFLYMAEIDGVKIQVIKEGSRVITGCPLGNKLFKGFTPIDASVINIFNQFG